jgi:hypothetical protein
MHQLLAAGALFVGLSAATTADAQDRLGATSLADSARAAAAAPRAIGEVSPFVTYTNASFTTAGVGLRNRLLGSIEAPGNPTVALKAAYLYWAVISNGAVPTAARSPKIARRSAPVVSAKALTAVQVGTGPSPCWGGTAITVYRATVPLSVAKGGGVYEISFPSGASGTPNNQNPWNGSAFPMLEGASLVLIFNGTNTVSLYDTGLAGQTIQAGTLSYSLRLPRAYTQYLRYDNIGADGQIGFGRQPTSDTSKEETYVGSTKIAGPGSVYNDSLWNGGVSGPVPQLWDTTAIDLTSTVSSGITILPLTHTAASDCITPVANVISVR